MRTKLNEASERPDGDSPEITRALFRKMRPASEILPKYIGQHATDELMRRKPGRPPSEEKRVARTFRLPTDIVEAYEATGTEWRKVVEATLRDHMPVRK